MVSTLDPREAQALAERRANAEAAAQGRPLPFPNLWDTLDPTKVASDASDAEVLESYRAFAKLCRKKTRPRLSI